jgi:cyclase
MLIPRVMPCLLVDNGRLVKTVKFKAPAYIGDPINAIKIYNEKEVDELILVDITATLESRAPSLEILAEVADECFMPMCYGGGITTLDQIRTIFRLGMEKAAINSHAFKDPDFIARAADAFGSQSIILSMDVKKSLFGKYSVWVQSGRKDTRMDPVEYAQRLTEKGAGEILLNSIDRDGTWGGYDVALIKKVADAVPVPVIACGGAARIGDFRQAVQEGGASACAAGSMVVYQGQGLGVLINFPARADLESIFA